MRIDFKLKQLTEMFFCGLNYCREAVYLNWKITVSTELCAFGHMYRCLHVEQANYLHLYSVMAPGHALA